MSSFNIAKKLHPAKQAWESFKTAFQSKLQKLEISKAIKTAKKYCITALCSIRVVDPRKLYALTRRSPPRSSYNFHSYSQQNQLRRSISAIYVDELFPGQSSINAMHHMSSFCQKTKAKEMVGSSSCVNKAEGDQGTVSKVEKQHQIASPGVKIVEKKALERKAADTGESSTSGAVAKPWKVPLLRQFRGVDERAEEFISKFRQEMKLDREQSIVDFQEMLARGI